MSHLRFINHNCTLTNYKSKPKKIFLLSSKHKFVKIEKTNKYLPENVAYYNNTKFGVDVTYQMVRKYSSKSKFFIFQHSRFSFRDFNILDCKNGHTVFERTDYQIISKNILFVWTV